MQVYYPNTLFFDLATNSSSIRTNSSNVHLDLKNPNQKFLQKTLVYLCVALRGKKNNSFVVKLSPEFQQRNFGKYPDTAGIADGTQTTVDINLFS